MSIKRLAVALLTVSGLALAQAAPALAQNVRVLNADSASTLRVPMNRAVVVETEQPFAELSIANPGIADISTLSDRSIYVLGKMPGRTTLTVLGVNGDLMSNVEVQVTPDIAEFRERLRQILPNEKIEVRTANDGIVLSGTVSTPARLDAAFQLAQRYAPERVSNLMSVGGTQQVMLKVRFAEMQRGISKSLGGSLQVTGGTHGTLSSGNFATASASNPAGTLGFRVGGGSLTAQVLIEALETQGMARTLAEPNLTALSGQQASFLAGGEYPIPVVVDGNVSIDYRPFGVELTFTPRVLEDNVINLELEAAVSSLDGANTVSVGGTVVNAFRRRSTETTVELRDGESFAIAGLLEDDFRSGSTAVPWISELPILGALFRSVNYQRSQTELVIIITAHLVTPTRGEALMLPTDRVRPPSERELFLDGRLTARGGGAVGEVARQDFGGSYGYVME
ncbi:type II and III secretion system protein family protein [Roseibaca sp. V10]|mgnify:CR=1 FL=1|uniref:Type II and III secretion system protein family protein n=1 Tax=Roseinatronobacter domitianus TaxID=2940293 RepID=A0ABT0M4Q3_9RHOB|nr:type II and III secretion system protein family protein [Roseibaca domitiana]MCL1629623.1 type II and III secretion system protein family protein [Roseibaca domitiana]